MMTAIFCQKANLIRGITTLCLSAALSCHVDAQSVRESNQISPPTAVMSDSLYKAYEKARKLCEQGHKKLMNDDYASALEILFEAAEYEHSAELNSYVFDYIANCYYKLGDLPKAIDYGKKSLSQDFDNPQAVYNLGVYLYLAGDNKALNAFDLYIIKTEENSQKDEYLYNAYGLMGVIYERKGDYEHAEQAYKTSIETNPTPIYYQSLATLYVKLERYTEAIECYKKCISLNPQSPDNILTYYMLGKTFHASENTKEAINAFNDCIQCFENNRIKLTPPIDSGNIRSTPEYRTYSEALLNVARLSYPSRDRLEKYLKVMNDSSMQGNMEPLDYISLANTYDYLQMYEEGRKTTEYAYSKYPNDVDIMYSYSRLMDDSNPDKIILLNKILDTETTASPSTFDYGTAYYNITKTYCNQGQYYLAMPYAEKAAAKNPEHDYIWEILGEIYFFIERYDDCINAMTNCLACEDCNMQASALLFRGKAYKHTGQRKKGKKDLQDALIYEQTHHETNYVDDVYYPQVSQLPQNIKVKRVILSSIETKVELEVTNTYVNGWININPSTKIVANGKDYKIKAASGIPFSPKRYYFGKNEETATFTLTFPPIPKDIQEIDLIESKGNGWKLYGIKLTSARL